MVVCFLGDLHCGGGGFLLLEALRLRYIVLGNVSIVVNLFLRLLGFYSLFLWNLVLNRLQHLLLLLQRCRVFNDLILRLVHSVD